MGATPPVTVALIARFYLPVNYVTLDDVLRVLVKTESPDEDVSKERETRLEAGERGRMSPSWTWLNLPSCQGLIHASAANTKR